MTTPAQPEAPNATTPPTSSGAANTAEPARVPAGTPEGGQFVNPLEYRYRAEDGVEPYMVGKTPREAAQLVAQYFKTGQAPVQQYQPQQYQQPQYQQPQPNARPTRDEWALDPGAAYERDMAWQRQNEFQPALQQTWQAHAELARAQAEMRYKDDFTRFGPEIDLELRNLPPNQRTMQAYDLAVNIVKGRHAHEISEDVVRKRVQQEIERMSAAGSVIRPDGNGGMPVGPANDGISLDSEELPAAFKEACRKANVQPRDIDNFLSTTRLYGDNLREARKQYVEAIKRGAIITEGSAL